MNTLALFVASAACGCALPTIDGEPTGSSASAIAGGEPAPEQWSVVGLLNGHGACSGTLIAPNLVLTAHHCVADSPPGNVQCGSATFGPTYANPMSLTTRDTVFAVWRHWVTSVEVPPGSDDVCGGDLAVLFLEDNVEPAEAWPMPPRIDEDPAVEEPYRAVGFGATVDDGTGSGTRRQRDGLKVRCVGAECSPVFQVQSNEWMGETGICPGDSGGPAVDEAGRVIGVTSRGGAACSTPIYSGVAPWADWLKAMGAKAAQQGGYEPWPWVTGGSTLPLDPPDPQADAGPEASTQAAEDSPGSSSGCALASSRPAGFGSWGVVVVAGLAAAGLRRRSPARARRSTSTRLAGVALGAFSLAFSGCRCGPSEDELPANRAQPSSSAGAMSACPPRPDWAGAFGASAGLEVLHAGQTASGPHGTGYRMHEDGRFETYDDIELHPDDAGRMAFRKVPGAWRERGVVTDEAKRDVEKLVRETSAAALQGLQPTKVHGGTAFTLVTVRRGGAVMESCYYGQETPAASDAVVKQAHDLVNRVRK